MHLPDRLSWVLSRNLKDEWNGCVQSARQQANDLFAVAMIYLDMHKDAHHFQHSTQWPNGITFVWQVLRSTVLGNPHCFLCHLTQLTPRL